MTNGDKIRGMTDEELARYLCDLMGVALCGCECPLYNFCLMKPVLLVDWLEQECVEKEVHELGSATDTKAGGAT